MPSISEIIALLPGIPLPHVIAILGVGILGLAFFTVHAVLTIAKGRDR